MFSKKGLFKKRTQQTGGGGRLSPEPPKSQNGALSRVRKVMSTMVFGGKSHPTKCGFSDKLYSTYDLVMPISDSLSRLNVRSHASGGLGFLLKSTTKPRKTVGPSSSSYQPFNSTTTDKEVLWSGAGYRMQAVDDQADNFASGQSSTSPTAPVVCQGCGTRDPCKLKMDEHAGEWVCECGAVGAKFTNLTDFKETNDTEKSKARADNPQAEKRKDRFAHVPVNAPNRPKRIRESMGLETNPVGSSVPDQMKSKLKLGFADACANKATDKPTVEMEKKHVNKLVAVITEINNLVVQMAPVDPQVGKIIRIKVDRVYRDSYKHTRVCTNKNCQMALIAKPSCVIAHKLFVYTIEQLCKGAELADGVSKTQLTSLHERVSASQIFCLRDNATQHEAILAMINLLDTGDVCMPCPVVESDADEETALKTPISTKSARGKSANARGSICRQDSDLQPSPVMVVREAVFKLSEQFGYDASVRDAAVDALGNREFSSVIKNDTVIPHTASKFGKAYILLRSIQEEKGATSGFIDHSAHVRRVNMASYNVEDLVTKMRMLLPKASAQSSTSSTHYIEDEDECFY